MKKIYSLLFSTLLTLSVFAGDITVADGTETNSYLPVYGFWADTGFSSQFIYSASSLSGLEAGSKISALQFYSSKTSTAFPNGEITIRLADVEQTTISSYIDDSKFQTVYKGAFEIKNGVLAFVLSEAYTYNGGNLLVTIVLTKVSSACPSTSFYGITATGNGLGRYISGGQPFDNVRNFLPKVTFEYGGGAGVTCDEPTQLKNTITPDGGIFSWQGEEDAQYQWCVVAKDAEPADWTLLEKNVFTCTVTGLTTGSEYDFCVRTYCSESDQSAAYKRSFTPTCEAPANLQLTDLTAHSAAFEWKSVPGVTGYQCTYVLAESALDWTGVATQKAVTLSLDELQASTSYDLYVRSYFSASVQSEPAKLTFRTDCDAKALPWKEAFLTNVLPECWTIANRTGYGWTVYDGSSDEMASICIRFNAKGGIGYVDTLELPTVLFSEDAILKMKVRNAHGLDVKLYASADGGATRKLVVDLSEEIDDPTNKEYDLSELKGENTLYLYGKATGNFHYFDFDNIQIVAKPCSTPKELNAEVSSTGAVVTWEAGNDEAAWNIRYKAVGATEWTEAKGIEELTYTIAGLISGTEYEVQVQAACNEDKLSTWTSSVKFTPTCPTPTNITFSTISEEGAIVAWESAESSFKLQYKEFVEDDWSEAVTVNAKTYTLSALDAYTVYDVRVQAACGGEFVEGQFTTRCATKEATEIPFSEDFEAIPDNYLPECWFVLPNDTLARVMTMSEGGKKLYMTGIDERWVVLPAIDIKWSTLTLSFSFSGSATLEVGYLTAEDPATFVSRQEISTSPAACVLKDVPDDAKYIAIHYVGTQTWATAYIDDVVLDETSLTGLDTINSLQSNRKSIENGQLVIEHNGIRYNAQGVVIK